MKAIKNPLLVIVVGPTAIGKTSLGIQIAKAFETEIISADSRQFFKEMHIGTAVPSEMELSEIPHHFIQNRKISEPYSVGEFEREALVLLDRLFKDHPLVVMVGGSGLYIDAVVKGLDHFPKIPKGIREALIQEYQKHGIEYLQQELSRLDPDYTKQVDMQNSHRLIRALEVCKASNKPYSSFLNSKSEERKFKSCFVGLHADRSLVYERINNRVDQMMEDGLLEEAKSLYQHRNLNALQTVGYKELFDYFDGKIRLEEAISEIKKNTRRFAKRQGTWFRKNPDIKWFEPTDSLEDILNFIETKNA